MRAFMAKLKIHPSDWILVCDGKKALILENLGADDSPNLHVRTVLGHDDPRTRDLGTDAPGRAFASIDSRRGFRSRRLACCTCSAFNLARRDTTWRVTK